MSANRMVAAAVWGCLFAPAIVLADQPVTGPASAAERQELNATVATVRGMVEIRDDEAQPWRMAKVGTALPVGAECRTGPRSSITLTMPPDQTIILDRLGTVKILEAFRSENRLKTDLGMKYGRVRYQVEAAGLEHESIIRSPSNALAVRGSDVEMTDDGMDARIRLFGGVGQTLGGLGNQNQGNLTLGTGASDSYGDSPIVLGLEDTSPSDHTFKQAVAPCFSSASLSSGEQLIVSNNNSVGLQTGLTTLRPQNNPGAGAPPIENVMPIATGKLSFMLSWTGDQASGAVTPDLDLFVISPRGEKLEPGETAFRVASGGVMSVNDHGGSKPKGNESAIWEPTFPLGHYTYGARYVGTGDPATFSILVLLDDRQQLNPPYEDTLTEYDPDVSFTLDVQPATQQPQAPASASAKPKPARHAAKPAANGKPARPARIVPAKR